MKTSRKFIDVIAVNDLTNVESIHREMMLVRLNLSADSKDQIRKTIDTYKWKVAVSAAAYIILEITGDKSQIDFALARLEPLGIADMTRTGIVALDLEN